MDYFFNIRALESTLKDFQFQGESPVSLTKNSSGIQCGGSHLFLTWEVKKEEYPEFKASPDLSQTLSQKSRPGTMAHTCNPITQYSGSLNSRLHRVQGQPGLQSETLSDRKSVV